MRTVETVARVRPKRVFRLADYNRMFLLEPTTRGNNLAPLSPLSTVRCRVWTRKPAFDPWVISIVLRYLDVAPRIWINFVRSTRLKIDLPVFILFQLWNEHREISNHLLLRGITICIWILQAIQFDIDYLIFRGMLNATDKFLSHFLALCLSFLWISLFLGTDATYLHNYNFLDSWGSLENALQRRELLGYNHSCRYLNNILRNCLEIREQEFNIRLNRTHH